MSKTNKSTTGKAHSTDGSCVICDSTKHEGIDCPDVQDIYAGDEGWNEMPHGLKIALSRKRNAAGITKDSKPAAPKRKPGRPAGAGRKPTAEAAPAKPVTRESKRETVDNYDENTKVRKFGEIKIKWTTREVEGQSPVAHLWVEIDGTGASAQIPEGEQKAFLQFIASNVQRRAASNSLMTTPPVAKPVDRISDRQVQNGVEPPVPVVQSTPVAVPTNPTQAEIPQG